MRLACGVARVDDEDAAGDPRSSLENARLQQHVRRGDGGDVVDGRHERRRGIGVRALHPTDVEVGQAGRDDGEALHRQQRVLIRQVGGVRDERDRCAARGRRELDALPVRGRGHPVVAAARQPADRRAARRVPDLLAREELIDADEDRVGEGAHAAGVERGRLRHRRGLDVVDVDPRRERPDVLRGAARLEVEDVRADDRVVARALRAVGAAAGGGPGRGREGNGVRRAARAARADRAARVADLGDADRVLDRAVEHDVAGAVVLDVDERR